MMDITGVWNDGTAERGNQLRRQAAQSADDRKLREACQGFEAMFLSMMYKEMRKTVHDNPLFGTSNGEKIWQSMLDDEMMNNVSKSGGVGLADMMYEQLKAQGNAFASVNANRGH